VIHRIALLVMLSIYTVVWFAYGGQLRTPLCVPQNATAAIAEDGDHKYKRMGGFFVARSCRPLASGSLACPLCLVLT